MDRPLRRCGQLVEILAGLLIVLGQRLEMRAAAVGFDVRQQRFDGVGDRSDQRNVDLRAPPDLGAAHIDLDDSRVLWVELLVGQVGAEHEQGIAVLQRGVAGGEPEQTGHAHVIGVVVFDELLAAQRMDDRSLELLGDGEQLIVGTLGAGTGEDRRLLALVEGLGRGFDLGRSGDHVRRVGPDLLGGGIDVGQADVAGNDEDGHAALLDGFAHGDAQQAGHLFGRGDVLNVDAAVAEQLGRMGLLEVVRADLVAGDLCGDGQHGDPRALGVEEPVDEVEVAGSAAARADREFTGQGGLAAGGEGGGFLVADVNPFELRVDAQRIGESVERVTRDSVDALDSAGYEGIDDVSGDGGH